MRYSTENIFIQELHLLLAAGKLVANMSAAESWHAFRLLAISPARQSRPSRGNPGRARGRMGRDSLDGEHQPLHQRCPHLHGRTIPHTHCSLSLSQLFEMPPSQQNISVANIAM